MPDRRDVLVDLGAAPDVREGPDARERHDAGEATDGRAVADLAVARDAGVVDDDDAVAEAAIVRHVARRPQQALLADLCPVVGPGRSVHRDALPDTARVS